MAITKKIESGGEPLLVVQFEDDRVYLFTQETETPLSVDEARSLYAWLQRWLYDVEHGERTDW